MKCEGQASRLFREVPHSDATERKSAELTTDPHTFCLRSLMAPEFPLMRMYHRVKSDLVGANHHGTELTRIGQGAASSMAVRAAAMAAAMSPVLRQTQ